LNIPVTVSPNPERRLSVLFGSRLEPSESHSSAPGDHYADVLASRISVHRGIIIHVAGSLVLAEFEDAAEAVNCAIDIQDRIAQFSKIHPDERSFGVSIGIHYGEMYLSDGACKGTGVDAVMEVLSFVPPASVYITQDVFVRVRLLLPLKFDNIAKRVFSSGAGEKDILSVAWKSVTENLEASLKRLGEDDFQRATTLSSKLGFDASKKATSLVLIFFMVFLFVLLKALKLF
jgi:hypothetical protein